MSPEINKAGVEKEQKAIREALRLRAAGPPVTRLSRKALLVLGGGLALALGAALIWATSERPGNARPEPPPKASPPAPRKVLSLPTDYLRPETPPPLGPPLPGDLGRPMLRAAQAAHRPDLDPVAALPRRTEPSRADETRDRRAVARASGLFLAVTAAPTRDDPPARAPAPLALGDPRTTSPERLQAPASPYVLQAGTVIPAALITGLASDLAGLAIAQVTQDVRDSLGGGHLLAPAGSRLIGVYGTDLSSGQTRLSVTWTRLILPSGRSIVLDNLPAADPAGMAGLRDVVDHHGRAVLGAAALSTVLAIGAEAGDSDESDLVRAVRRGAESSVGDAGRQAVGVALARRPTLTIRPGAPLRVLVTRDLVLEPYLERPRP